MKSPPPANAAAAGSIRQAGLPRGIRSSIWWMVGLLTLLIVTVSVDTAFLVFGLSAAGHGRLYTMLIGSSVLSIAAGLEVVGWLRTTRSNMLELAGTASDLALASRPPDLSDRPPDAALPRLSGPFPVRSDDEIGYLAARLNGLASTVGQSLESVESERSQMRSILASMNDGVVLTDLRGYILVANPAAGRLLGQPLAGLRDKDIAEVVSSEALRRQVENAAMRRQSGSMPLVVAGSGRHLLAVVNPFGAATAGAVIVIQDQEEQNRLDSVRRDFIANVSHELRTPLTSIRAMAETLIDGASQDPGVAGTFLQIILHETDRLARLTDDILDLARYEAGRLQCEEMDPGALLREVETQVRPKLEKAGLQFETRVPSLPRITADRAALRQVLLNLLDNAAKYTPDGCVTVRAEAAASRFAAPDGVAAPGGSDSGSGNEPGWIAVSVSDTGPGIPPAHLPRIFERFYRVDQARSRAGGGTGLGLSIVKHVIEAHGGRAEVSSTVGEGTTFTLWLPACADRPESRPVSDDRAGSLPEAPRTDPDASSQQG